MFYFLKNFISLANGRTQDGNKTAYLKLFLESLAIELLIPVVGILFRVIYSC